MEEAIKEFQKYLINSNADKKDLFDVGPKKISLQICFHKIPNLINEKPILW